MRSQKVLTQVGHAYANALAFVAIVLKKSNAERRFPHKACVSNGIS